MISVTRFLGACPVIIFAFIAIGLLARSFGDPGLAGLEGAVSASVLALAALAFHCEKIKISPGRHAVFSIIGVLASVPLIPNKSQIPTCPSCSPVGALAIIGAFVGLAIHIFALSHLIWRSELSVAVLKWVSIVAIFGQAYLLWTSPKFCPFCVISGIGLLSYIEREFIVRAFEMRYGTQYLAAFAAFCVVAASLRFSYAGDSSRTFHSEMTGKSIHELVRKRGRIPRFLFFGATWCHVCSQVSSKIVEARIDAELLYPCDETKTGQDCFNADYKPQIFPTLVIMNDKGIIVRELPGLPSAAILSDLKSEYQR